MRLDEMIQEIYSDETLPLEEGMDKDQQKRIETMVLTRITQKKVTRYRKSRRRKFLGCLLVAVLAMAMTMVVSAAKENDWDLALLEFMGLEDADTIQWSDGSVEIQASSTCNGTDYSCDSYGISQPLTITAVSSIGDQNAAYIRFETDYELPEDFDPNRDYILPGDMSLFVSRKNPEKDARITNHGSIFTSDTENGRLIFMLYVADCPEINKSYLTLTFEDLYLYHDLGSYGEDVRDLAENEPEMVYQGSWSLNWKYAYRSNVRSRYVFQKAKTGQTEYWITRVEVSPLGVRVEGMVNPLHRAKSAVWMEMEKITYQDGRSLTVEGSSAGGCRDGIWLENYFGVDVIGEVLHVDQIKSITMRGQDASIDIAL